MPPRTTRRKRPEQVLSFADLAARRRGRLRVMLPPEDPAPLEQAVEVAKEQLQMQRLRSGFTGSPEEQETLTGLEAALADAEEALEDASTVLWVEGLPKPALAALRAEFPATDEQVKAHEKTNPGQRLTVDRDGFMAALIASSLVMEPKLTADEVVKLREEWSSADFEALEQAVDQVNSTSRIRVLGN